MRVLTTCLLLLIFSCSETARDKQPVPASLYYPPWDLVDEAMEQYVSDQPPDGFVPDERTAIAIAEAVASALYGQELTKSERPFRGRLEGDAWTVIGALPGPIEGGTALIQISKSDGRILFAVHEE